MKHHQMMDVDTNSRPGCVHAYLHRNNPCSIGTHRFDVGCLRGRKKLSDFAGGAKPNTHVNVSGAPSAILKAHTCVSAASATPLRGLSVPEHVLEAELAASHDIACRRWLCTAS